MPNRCGKIRWGLICIFVLVTGIFITDQRSDDEGESCLLFPQPPCAGDQRYEHKRNRDPGECGLIRSKSDREKDKTQDQKDRGGTSAGLWLEHDTIIHKLSSLVRKLKVLILQSIVIR